MIVAGYFGEEILEALGGGEAVVAQVEIFLLGLSDAGLLALVVALLGVLTVFHFGVGKPGLTALIVTIFLNETVVGRPDEEWERRPREYSPEYHAIKRRAEGDEDVPEKTGTWRHLFLP